MAKKQVIILGAIGKTERMNRDAFRVLGGGGYNVYHHCSHRKRSSVGAEKMEKKIVKIGVIDDKGYELDNRVYTRGGYHQQSKQETPESTLYARQKQIKMIGQMDNTLDHTFESANRVYDRHCCLPTIPTCCGGNLQPKVIRKYAKN